MKTNDQYKDEADQKNPTLAQTNPAGSGERDPRGKANTGTDSTTDSQSSIGNTNRSQMGMGTLGGQFDDERGGGTSGLQYRGNESQLTGDAVSAQGDNIAADRFGTADESGPGQYKETSNGERGEESNQSQAK